MAIDMIEDNELSALAPMRNGGRFKNEMFSRPSIQRNKKSISLNQFINANGYDTSIIDSGYANFDFTPKYLENVKVVIGKMQGIMAKYEGDNAFKETDDELKNCDALRKRLLNFKLDTQNFRNEIIGDLGNQANNNKVLYEIGKSEGIFDKYKRQLEKLIEDKKCDDLDKKRLQEESDKQTSKTIVQASIDAQLGITQAQMLAQQMAGQQKGMSGSTKFMIIGGVAIVGIVLVSILRR
jgi:hypothetical protein